MIKVCLKCRSPFDAINEKHDLCHKCYINSLRRKEPYKNRFWSYHDRQKIADTINPKDIWDVVLLD